MLFAVVLCSSPAFADDKLTEHNMTQRDYDHITETESSVAGEPPAESPMPIHDFSEPKTQEAQDIGGVVVIAEKDWKHESPQERDAHIRRIRDTMPKGSILLITVPKGDVWIFPPQNANLGKDYNRRFFNLIHPWTDAEKAVHPIAVAPEKQVAHSDTRGTGSDALAAAPAEDP